MIPLHHQRRFLRWWAVGAYLYRFGHGMFRVFGRFDAGRERGKKKGNVPPPRYAMARGRVGADAGTREPRVEFAGLWSFSRPKGMQRGGTVWPRMIVPKGQSIKPPGYNPSTQKLQLCHPPLS